MDEIRFNQPLRGALKEENLDKKKNNFLRFLFKKAIKVLVVVIILLGILGALFFGRNIFGEIFKIRNETYSAVFLTNGQVYFGKMITNNKSEIILNNVYYIQINEGATREEMNQTLNQTRFNLVKLGNELHGPTDELFINKSQVVFYEYLRDDSKVVESIVAYKK